MPRAESASNNKPEIISNTRALAWFLRNDYSQFIQLLPVNSRRSIQHYIPSCIILRESDKITDDLRTANDSTKAVEANSNTSVGRGAVFKSAEQETELMLSFLFIHPE